MIINDFSNFIIQEVKIIFDIFGEDIRLVGGCVRDMILKKPITDFDFACKFSPNKTLEILNNNNIKAIPTGAKFGTITAVINQKNFQITTLRNDFNYDGRYCEVNFTSDFLQDAKRRDFTINAMYLDKNLKIYDYFNGLKDLEDKKIRFIGDANQRISEDYLRILRFFRFTANYSNEIDQETLEICLNYRKNLQKISKERIRNEFCRILLSVNESLILKILRIFNESKLDIDLWGCQLDYKAVENYLLLQKYLDKSSLKTVKIIVAFDVNNNNKNFFFDNFKCTKLEKKIINIFLKITEKYDFSSIDELKINQLLINLDKILLIKIFIIFQAKNSSKLSQNNLENIITYIINKKIPRFPVEFSDLKKMNIELKKSKNVINNLKILWATNDFNILKEELLNKIK